MSSKSLSAILEFPAPGAAHCETLAHRSNPLTGPAYASIILAAMIALSACAPKGGYYKDDGPPRRPKVDVHRIPDAVPREEPLSNTGNRPYTALGKRYVPMSSVHGYRKRGTASWYGRKFHGKRTSSGEPYDMYQMTAAHRTLPLPSYVRVTNLRNGKSVVVRVNDRGPFLHNRLIDLSYAAAYKLGIIATGTGYVEVNSITGDSIRTATIDAGNTAGTPVKDLSSDSARYYVQYGAFAQSANAESLVQKLHEKGIRFAHIQQGNDGYFRVRSGPFSSAASAEYLMLRGADFGLSTTIVME